MNKTEQLIDKLKEFIKYLLKFIGNYESNSIRINKLKSEIAILEQEIAEQKPVNDDSLNNILDEMKTTFKLIDERLTVDDGHFKGARITVSKETIAELMEDYHRQYYVSDEEIKARIPYPNAISVSQTMKNVGWIKGGKYVRNLIFKK